MSTVSNGHISNWYNEGTKKCTKSTHLYIRHIFRIFPNRNTIKTLFGYVCCNPYIPIEVKSKFPSNPDNQPTKAINNFANYTYVNPIFSLVFFFFFHCTLLVDEHQKRNFAEYNKQHIYQNELHQN